MPSFTRAELLRAAALIPFLLKDAVAQPQGSPSSAARTSHTIYRTDFVDGFEINDKGIGTNGAPCWRSDFPYGGRIVNNGEVGLYADPAVFPGTNPFPVVRGKRLLRSERLADPIDWNGKPYAYAAAVMSAAHLPVGPGSRVECRMSLPHVMRKGYFPAFWLLPIKKSNEANWPWPPEIDVIEWWLFNEGDRPDAFWNSLHTGTVTDHKNDARQIPLSSVGIEGDLTQPLTYGVEITDRDVLCFVNGREISRRANPAPSREWYIVLNLAVAGDPWPGAPSADAPFPQHVVLHELTISKIA